MRAFTQLWDRIGLERYGVTDPKARRFRYGVQVNSLGLTEAQPENNVQRIVLEMLGVTLSKRRPGPLDPAAGVERGPRACPARGTSSGRCACSRCSPTRPTSSSTPTSSTARRVIEALDHRAGRRRVGRARRRARPRRRLRGHRGAQGPAGRAATPSGCGASSRATSPSSASTASPRRCRPRSRARARSSRSTRPSRPRRSPSVDEWRVRPRRRRREALARRAAPGRRLRRERHAGHHRPRPRRRHHRRVGRGAARGVRRVPRPHRRGGGRRRRRRQRRPAGHRRAGEGRCPAARRGSSSPSPGLDGHSNGAEQIAVAARDAGLEVIYQGIRLTPEQIAAVALDGRDLGRLTGLDGGRLRRVERHFPTGRSGAGELDRLERSGAAVGDDHRHPLLGVGLALHVEPLVSRPEGHLRRALHTASSVTVPLAPLAPETLTSIGYLPWSRRRRRGGHLDRRFAPASTVTVWALAWAWARR